MIETTTNNEEINHPNGGTPLGWLIIYTIVWVGSATSFFQWMLKYWMFG